MWHGFSLMGKGHKDAGCRCKMASQTHKYSQNGKYVPLSKGLKDVVCLNFAEFIVWVYAELYFNKFRHSTACEEVSNTAEILQKHIAVEHPEKCDKCNFKSSDIEVVMKHMKAKHSPKELCTFFMKGKCTRKPCKFSHETTTQTSTVTQKVDRSQEPCKRGPQCSYKAKNRCYYFHLSWSSQVQKPKVQVQPRNVQFQLPNVQVQPPRVQTQPPRVQDQVPRGCDLSKPPPTVQKRRQPEGTHKKTQGLWCKFQEECRDGPLCRFRHFGPDPTTYTPTAQRGQMFL